MPARSFFIPVSWQFPWVVCLRKHSLTKIKSCNPKRRRPSRAQESIFYIVGLKEYLQLFSVFSKTLKNCPNGEFSSCHCTKALLTLMYSKIFSLLITNLCQSLITNCLPKCNIFQLTKTSFIQTLTIFLPKLLYLF